MSRNFVWSSGVETTATKTYEKYLRVKIKARRFQVLLIFLSNNDYCILEALLISSFSNIQPVYRMYFPLLLYDMFNVGYTDKLSSRDLCLPQINFWIQFDKTHLKWSNFAESYIVSSRPTYPQSWCGITRTFDWVHFLIL